MSTQAHQAILDRAEARELVQTHLQPQVQLFERLTDFGTNLIVRLIHTKKDRGIQDAIAIAVFLRQIVAMLDSFSVQLREGMTHAAYLLARSAFEASVFSEWMLYADHEAKANSFYVQCLREERRWVKRGIKDDPDESSFVELMRECGIDIHENRPWADTEMTVRLAEIDRVLAQPQLAPINQQFEDHAKKRRKGVYWYQLHGASTIFSVAK